MGRPVDDARHLFSVPALLRTLRFAVTPVLLAVLAVGVVSIALSANAEEDPGPVPSQAGTGVPFETLRHLLIVKVAINGSEDEYNFAVDTGALTFVDKNVAGKLLLKQKGMMAKIDSLNVSGFMIHNVFCFTNFDFGRFEVLGAPIHGLIGSNLMERYRMTFDFKSQYIAFSSDTTSMEPADSAMFFTFRNHPVNSAPLVRFEVGGRGLEGMIDTGQPYPLVLPLGDFEEYRDSLAMDFVKSRGLMEEWPMTKADHNYLARLESFELGSTSIDTVICLFGELPPPLSMPLIGNDFLSQFKIVINYPRDEILLIPYEDAKFKSNFLSAGLRPDISEEGQVIVKGIWEGSPAERSGVKPGDIILSFNSVKATPTNLIELINILEDDAVRSVSIEILDAVEGSTREVSLNKALLF